MGSVEVTCCEGDMLLMTSFVGIRSWLLKDVSVAYMSFFLSAVAEAVKVVMVMTHQVRKGQ